LLQKKPKEVFALISAIALHIFQVLSIEAIGPDFLKAKCEIECNHMQQLPTPWDLGTIGLDWKYSTYHSLIFV
jgi:hypothetical protein